MLRLFVSFEEDSLGKRYDLFILNPQTKQDNPTINIIAITFIQLPCVFGDGSKITGAEMPINKAFLTNVIHGLLVDILENMPKQPQSSISLTNIPYAKIKLTIIKKQSAQTALHRGNMRKRSAMPNTDSIKIVIGAPLWTIL